MTQRRRLPQLEQSPLQRILIGALFFAFTLSISIAGYMLAGWSFIDAAYMTIITVFGVGYGEIGPMTPELRAFTIFVIVAGTSSAVYTVGGFFQALAEGEMNRLLGARRMSREIDRLQNHVIICGLGRIGRLLARKLADSEQAFVVIDSNPDRVERGINLGYLVYEGNATDEAVLRAAGIERAKALATVLPDDAENVFITLTARGMNPRMTIVARGETASTENKLKLAGADRVVLPASIGAERIAQILNHPSTLYFLEEDAGRAALSEMLLRLDIKLDEVDVTSNSPLANRTIGDVEVRGKGTFIVVALLQGGGMTLVHPPQSTVLGVGDTLIVMGHSDDMPTSVLGRTQSRTQRYRGLMQ